jgi:hypothetical protein
VSIWTLTGLRLGNWGVIFTLSDRNTSPSIHSQSFGFLVITNLHYVIYRRPARCPTKNFHWKSQRFQQAPSLPWFSPTYLPLWRMLYPRVRYTCYCWRIGLILYANEVLAGGKIPDIPIRSIHGINKVIFNHIQFRSLTLRRSSNRSRYFVPSFLFFFPIPVSKLHPYIFHICYPSKTETQPFIPFFFHSLSLLAFLNLSHFSYGSSSAAPHICPKRGCFTPYRCNSNCPSLLGGP